MSTEQIIDCWQNGVEPYTVFNQTVRRGQGYLKLWNQKLGCFEWVKKSPNIDGPYLRKISGV